MLVEAPPSPQKQPEALAEAPPATDPATQARLKAVLIRLGSAILPPTRALTAALYLPPTHQPRPQRGSRCAHLHGTRHATPPPHHSARLLVPSLLTKTTRRPRHARTSVATLTVRSCPASARARGVRARPPAPAVRPFASPHRHPAHDCPTHRPPTHPTPSHGLPSLPTRRRPASSRRKKVQSSPLRSATGRRRSKHLRPAVTVQSPPHRRSTTMDDDGGPGCQGWPRLAPPHHAHRPSGGERPAPGTPTPRPAFPGT